MCHGPKGRGGGVKTQKQSGPEVWGGRRAGPRRVRPRRVGPRVGPRRVGSPKFRAFFQSPATFSLFLSLSGGSSRGFLVVFGSAGAVKCARLKFSGCCVKPRWPRSRRGYTPQPKSLCLPTHGRREGGEGEDFGLSRTNLCEIFFLAQVE